VEDSTIVNWRLYQDYEDEANKDSNIELTNSQQRPNKELTPNKNDKNNKNERIKEEIRYLAKNYTDNPDLITALSDFADMRKAIKKPLTTKAFAMMLEKLNSIGKTDGDKIDILNQSVMNSWQGIFELKRQQQPPSHNSSDSASIMPEQAWQEVSQNLDPTKRAKWSNEKIRDAVKKTGYDILYGTSDVDTKRAEFIKAYKELM